MSEKLIAEKLDVSRSTVVRDVKFWRKQSPEWITDLSRDYGYHLNYRMDLERLQNEIYELNKAREKANTSERIKISNSIVKIVKTDWELLNKAPMLASFNKFIQDNIDQKRKEFNGELGKDGIPRHSISFI